MAVLKKLKHIINKPHRAETQQALAASMAATDHILLLKVPAILAA